MEETMTPKTHSQNRRVIEWALWRPFLRIALVVMFAGGLALWRKFHDLRQSIDPELWLPIGIGVSCLLLGVTLAVAIIFARRKLHRGLSGAPGGERGPVQPWRVRKDWARGKVLGEHRSGFIAALVSAVFGSLIAGTMVFVSWPPKEPQQWRGWLFLLFPLAALCLVARAAMLGRRWLKYGDSVLHLRVVPLTPGGALEGVIEVPRRLLPQAGFTLRLNCVKRVTSGSGKHRHTDEENLWQAEHAVAADRLEPALSSLKIPVAFRLAPDAPPSSQVGQTEVLWRLEARAQMPGLDYATKFVLPVVATQPRKR
jgi:hypothetical protein